MATATAKLNSYILFWLDGKTSAVSGTDAADAMNRAGYGPGSIAALDFIGDPSSMDDYVFDREARSWKNKRYMVAA